MGNLDYRELRLDECEAINDMNPAQYIGRAWREKDGIRQLVEINYQDTNWPNGYENHLNNMKKTIIDGGHAVGVFDENKKLLGFSTVNNEFFGDSYRYVLLDQLFISLEYRGKGLGKALFMLSVEAAKRMGAEKIYICAGSAEETIGFYFSIGCREAEEVNKELYENDPRDLQLEYLL